MADSILKISVLVPRHCHFGKLVMCSDIFTPHGLGQKPEQCLWAISHKGVGRIRRENVL